MLWLQYRYGWDVNDVGVYLSVLGFAIAVNQIFVMKLIPSVLSEKNAVIFGFVASFLYYLLAGVLPKGWMLYFTLLILGFSSVANPCLRATLSVYVSDEEQGALQGALESLYTLSKVFACSAYGILLAWSENSDGFLVGGTINFVSALIMIPALISAMSALKKYPIKENSEASVNFIRSYNKGTEKIDISSCLS
mmetsp:Transcript_19956/g.45301  ORF Transcript_19956/g.45301 Transcript_19956/m.45301 type:complete len:194 (+) Transcript_19956:1112-1693(+)